MRKTGTSWRINLKAHCSCLAFWPSFCLSSESFPGNAFSPCLCSVVCVSAKRFSVPLTPLAQEFESASGITTLLRYYEPLRHPLGRSRLLIPVPRWFFTTQEGFPGSSTDLYPRAASNHPGDSDRCLLIASPSVGARVDSALAGFIQAGRNWPIPFSYRGRIKFAYAAAQCAFNSCACGLARASLQHRGFPLVLLAGYYSE